MEEPTAGSEPPLKTDNTNQVIKGSVQKREGERYTWPDTDLEHI